MKKLNNEFQIRVGVFLSYMSTGLNMAIQLLYTPVMIRLLGQSEYGLYTLVGSVVSYLSLFSLGFTGAYLRFFTRVDAKGDKAGVARLNGMFLCTFLLMSLMACICGFALSQFAPELFRENLSDLEIQKSKVLMQILVVNIALTFPASLFDSMISAQEQFIFQRVVNLLGILVNPLIALPLLLAGYGSVAVVMVTTAITLTKLIVNVYYCLRKLRVTFLFNHFDFRCLAEISSFSFFIFLNMIIDQINWSVDKVILGRVSGTAAVAIYGVGAQVNSLYISFSTAISSTFVPRVNRIVAENKENVHEDLSQLFTSVGRLQYMVLGCIATGFVFFGQYFITNIYSTYEYAEAYWVAILLILPALIPLIQNVGVEIQRAMNMHQFRSIVYFFMALGNTLISIPLGYRYGPIGTAAGTAVCISISNGFIMNYYYAKKIRLHIRAFWQSILELSRGMILPVFFGFIIQRTGMVHSVASFALFVGLYVVLYFVSFYYFGMNNTEKAFVKSVFRRFRRI